LNFEFSMPMNEEWVLWFFEGIVVAAALMILFTRSVFHAGLNLLVVVVAIGVIFGLYGAEFLFITQIMVYGGGILVLILFATMVTAKGASVPSPLSNKFNIPILLAATAGIVVAAVWVMAYQPKGVPFVVPTSQLGKSLIADYALPLEISGILLLVSLVGAALSAIHKPVEP
jgi:NADH:ubiquinone oxidoreductase subunit 6 (subunit J)